MRIFLSSTYEDLEGARAALLEALLADEHDARGMEDFGARSIETWRLCAEWIRESDVLMLLLGTGAGSLMPGEAITYTHAEYEFAAMRDIPILVFASAKHEVEIAADTIEALSGEARVLVEKFADFSAKAHAEQVAQWEPFRTPRELIGYARQALSNLEGTPARERPPWRDRPKRGSSVTINEFLRNRGFCTVLVDLDTLYLERVPRDPRTRIGVKLVDDVYRTLLSNGVPTTLFNSIAFDAPDDETRLEGRVQVTRAASVAVLVSEGAHGLRAAPRFYGGTAAVGEWRRQWALSHGPPGVQPTTRERYDDIDLHSCELANLIARFVDREIVRTFGATRGQLARSLVVTSASIGGSLVADTDAAQVLRVSLEDARRSLELARDLDLLAPTPSGYEQTEQAISLSRASRRFDRLPVHAGRNYQAVETYVPRTWPPGGELSTA